MASGIVVCQCMLWMGAKKWDESEGAKRRGRSRRGRYGGVRWKDWQVRSIQPSSVYRWGGERVRKVTLRTAGDGCGALVVSEVTLRTPSPHHTFRLLNGTIKKSTVPYKVHNTVHAFGTHYHFLALWDRQWWKVEGITKLGVLYVGDSRDTIYSVHTTSLQWF